MLRNLFLFLIILVMAGGKIAAADTLLLKTGELVEGAIVKQDEDFVRIQTKLGVAIPYYIEEIAEINGKEISSGGPELAPSDNTLPETPVLKENLPDDVFVADQLKMEPPPKPEQQHNVVEPELPPHTKPPTSTETAEPAKPAESTKEEIPSAVDEAPIPKLDVYDIIPELQHITTKDEAKETLRNYRLGVQAAELGDYRKAKEYFIESVNAVPDFIDGYYNLGIVCGLLGEYRQARDYLLTAIKFDPESADAFYGLGVTYSSLGDLDKARESFEKAIDLNPQMMDAYYKLAVVYGSLEKFDRAYRYLKKALKLDPDSIKVNYQMGIVASTLGRDDESVESFQKVIKMEPGFADAHYNLGLIYGSLKRYSDAIQEFLKVIALDDNYADAHFNLAMAHLGLTQKSVTIGTLGGYQEAKKHLEKARELYEQDSNAAEKVKAVDEILRTLP